MQPNALNAALRAANMPAQPQRAPQDASDPSNIEFWIRVDTLCSVTARRLLDDQVKDAFENDFAHEAPADSLVPFFWSRAGLLVQIEHHMGRTGVTERDLQNAVACAQDLQKHLAWLEGEKIAQHRSEVEQRALTATHEEVTRALAGRPHHGSIADQTYGGLVPEPARVKIVKAL